jgi:acyl dehydratase
VDESKVGKSYPPHEFEIEADRIRAYVDAVGEENPVHHDAAAAKEAGFRDLVAPPMFAVVYQFGALGPPVIEVVGDAIPRIVHGGQEFVWSEPVCAGDTNTTEATVTEVYVRDGKGFCTVEAVSRNQDGDEVVRGTWSNIVRGVEG